MLLKIRGGQIISIERIRLGIIRIGTGCSADDEIRANCDRHALRSQRVLDAAEKIKIKHVLLILLTIFRPRNVVGTSAQGMLPQSSQSVRACIGICLVFSV